MGPKAIPLTHFASGGEFASWKFLNVNSLTDKVIQNRTEIYLEKLSYILTAMQYAWKALIAFLIPSAVTVDVDRDPS